MEATIIISRYEENSDRGAIVNRSLKETVEVDLNTIEVGKPLPGLPNSIVRQYDITLLELEYSGKTFRLTPGKEEMVGYSGMGGQMGVCQDMVTNVKYAIEKPLFIQSGDKSIESRVKSRELNDPIGEGEVWLPNGDYIVSQHGGSRLEDDNGNLIYIPSVSSCMKYPNGDVKNLLLHNDKY